MSRRGLALAVLLALGALSVGALPALADADTYSVQALAPSPAPVAPQGDTGGSVTFRIQRSGPLLPGSIDYATADGTAVGGDPGSRPPVDYQRTSGTAAFAAGQDHVDVDVPLVSDDGAEPPETLLMNITLTPGGAGGGDEIAGGSAVASIANQAGAPCATLPSAGSSTLTLTVDGIRRRALVHVPPISQLGARPPLLLAYHGFGADGAFMERYTGLSALADRMGFVVAYPTGLDGRWRIYGNESAGAENDVDFGRAIIAHLERSLCLDSGREFAVGVSNGGGEVARMACELGGHLNAIATVAGDYHSAPPCRPRRPVSVLEVHGTGDPVVPYFGLSGHRGGSVPDFLGMWRLIDRCARVPHYRRVSRRQTRLVWRCASGTVVRHLKIRGLGHTWPGALPAPGQLPARGSATAEAWSFFRSLPSRSPLHVDGDDV